MKFTVLGASGFVGFSLVEHLRSKGFDVATPSRAELVRGGKGAGHVVYCIGFTGNFRKRLPETIEAHVNQLSHCLAAFEYSSFLYLSSTRIYGSEPSTAGTSESCRVCVRPSADSVYDLSKLLGEAICLATETSTVRVARLSNVFGPRMSGHTFLGSIVSDMNLERKLTIGEASSSCKDYIAIADVVDVLTQIATNGRERIYNVASGRLVTHAALAQMLQTLGASEIAFAEHAPCRALPQIDINRITSEFGIKPRGIEPALLYSLLNKADAEPRGFA